MTTHFHSNGRGSVSAAAVIASRARYRAARGRRHARSRSLSARRTPDRRTAGTPAGRRCSAGRSEEHTSELQSLTNLVCRLLLEKKKPQLCAQGTPHARLPVLPLVQGTASFVAGDNSGAPGTYASCDDGQHVLPCAHDLHSCIPD